MDRQSEAEDLGKAEADIAAGEARVTEQRARIEQLRADGHDVREAQRFLASLEAVLAEWRRHRETILRVIEQIDAGSI